MIDRGDMLFVRNAISHRECENLTDYEHYCFHCFSEPVNIEDTRSRNLTMKTDPFEFSRYFDVSANKFVSSFK